MATTYRILRQQLHRRACCWLVPAWPLKCERWKRTLGAGVQLEWEVGNTDFNGNASFCREESRKNSHGQ